MYKNVLVVKEGLLGISENKRYQNLAVCLRVGKVFYWLLKLKGHNEVEINRLFDV